MSLIKVEDIGFGLSGGKLDLTISIPAGDYLYNFRVYNQDDLLDSDCASDVGTDYMDDLVKKGKTRKEAFEILFEEKLSEYTDPSTQKTYEVYKLQYSIEVSQKNLTFIHMQIIDGDEDSCSETQLTIPLYNLTILRLSALELAKTIKEDCNIPREFLDKILQIKAIETALCCGAYCDAAKYWKMFYSNKKVKPIKKCGCHGGAA